MPYSVTVCKSCGMLTDAPEHGPEDEYCEAPDGFERIELFTEREVERRVRDARGDDERGINVKVCECGATWFGGNTKYCPAGHAYRFRTERYVPARSPQSEDHERCGLFVKYVADHERDRWVSVYCDLPVSHRGSHGPQGEDHEAGRARFGLCEVHGRVPVAIGSHDQAEICPYCGRDLSRVSPSRDGTAAEIERLRDRNAALERALGLAADEDLGLSRDGTVAFDPPLSERERDAIEGMRTAVKIVGGEEPVPYDIQGMAREVVRLRAEVERLSSRDGSVAVEDVRAQTITEIVTWLRVAGDTRFWNESFKAAADLIEREFGGTP